MINTCRNVARQGNLYYERDAKNEKLKQMLAANTAGFAKALRNFLRGPTDDATLRKELEEIVAADLMTQQQVEA